MLDSWLDWTLRDPSTYGAFTVIDVAETQAPTSAVKDHLRGRLRDARLDPAFLRSAAEVLGWDHIRETVVNASLPRGRTARRGEFGEVLACTALEQFHGYVIPVRKLSFAIQADQSLPGTDAIALKLDEQDEIAEMCFVESKLRTVGDTGAAVQGYGQLEKDSRQGMPDMLRFVAARLYEQQSSLSPVVMRYLRDRQVATEKDSFRLCLTWELSTWSETVLANLEDSDTELRPLTVDAVRIEGLAELTEELFTSIGVEEIVDDD